MPYRTAVLLFLSWFAAGTSWGQFRTQFVDGRVQVHGFFTQGYAVSNQNNYLTMNTSQGTAKMTDGGLNMSWQINNKLRVGAQVYARSIGELGKGYPTLDWALVDYRFRDWLGFRAGKVKTPLGLFTESQDQEFLYTWALLPQAVYPLDLRESSNAHVGGDLYGSVGLKRGGLLTYQLYAGQVPSDYRTGLYYGLQDAGYRDVTYETRTTGYDLRWTTPVSGLMAGISQSFSQRDSRGILAGLPFEATAKTYLDRTTAVYAQLNRGRWRLDTEWRATKNLTRIFGLPPAFSRNGQTAHPWFTALSYRVSRIVEVGAYHGQYRYTTLFALPGLTGADKGRMDDTTVALRLDPTSFWNFKIEVHFMDGVGSLLSSRGFYARNNPQGLQPATNMLVLRTGLNF
jgi:hypothetical protein